MESFSLGDGELLQRFRYGNAEAFRHIYDAWYHQLVYFGFVLTKNQQHAEDAATEAYINAWKTRHNFESLSHVKRFLFLSLKHKCIDFLRTAKTRLHVHNELYYNSEDEESVELAMLESEVIREIARQVNALPPQCAKVFSHIFFDGMTTEEVAAAMNISTKNVLNQKNIAVKQIRSILLKKGLLHIALCFAEIFS